VGGGAKASASWAGWGAGERGAERGHGQRKVGDGVDKGGPLVGGSGARVHRPERERVSGAGWHSVGKRAGNWPRGRRRGGNEPQGAGPHEEKEKERGNGDGLAAGRRSWADSAARAGQDWAGHCARFFPFSFSKPN
jgi:hypothetical protein